MLKINRKKLLIIFIVIVIAAFGIKKFIYDNPRALFKVAAGLDEPSSTYYFVMERIYVLCANENQIKSIINDLETDRNNYLHKLYIRTLGIVGEDSNLANYILVEIYSKYQNDKNRRGIIYEAIDSMGFIGNLSAVLVLQRLFENYDNHRMVIEKYPILRSLYLATGKIYKDQKENSLNLIVTEELENARGIIVRSKGRLRTFAEMMVLANLNRPDKFKRKFSEN